MLCSSSSLTSTTQQTPYAKLCESTVAELLATRLELRNALESLVETTQRLGAETDPRPFLFMGPRAPAAENYRVTVIARDLRFALLDILDSITWGILFPLQGGASIALEAAELGLDIRDSPLCAQNVWENRRRRFSALALQLNTAFATSFIASTEALASQSRLFIGGETDTCGAIFAALQAPRRILQLADRWGAPAPRCVQRARPQLLALALKTELEKLPRLLDDFHTTWRRYLRYTFSKQRAPISRHDSAAAKDAWLRMFALDNSWTYQGLTLADRVMLVRPAELVDLKLRPSLMPVDGLLPSLKADHAVA